MKGLKIMAIDPITPVKAREQFGRYDIMFEVINEYLRRPIEGNKRQYIEVFKDQVINNVCLGKCWAPSREDLSNPKTKIWGKVIKAYEAAGWKVTYKSLGDTEYFSFEPKTN